MDKALQRAQELKEALTDFVLDAEGELAVALETFSAEHLTRSQQQNMHQRMMVIDRFMVEGKVADQTPIDQFIQRQPKLAKSDRELLERWRRSFVGLFAIVKILADGFELMNWTTQKHYIVKQANPQALKEMERLKEGEIILTQIAPVSDTEWMFFSPWTSLGKLGKPKLAVAIGNFKNNYKNHLYSDAPELLEEAWKSVERYHTDFVEFFGADEVTLSGYELGKKLNQFQEIITQKNLEAAGIDRSKSLEELAEEAGISQEELDETAAAIGSDAKTISEAWKQQAANKMAAPQVELPPNLKKAEQVTALSHPRWGQMFLPNYAPLKAILEVSNPKETDIALVQKCLKDPEMNAFVWHRLAEQYPDAMETLLQTALDRPHFNLSTDLNPLLEEFEKPLDTDLPEIASVPIHLHNLFQEAVVEVNKSKSKGKIKKKKTGGFQN